MKSIEFDRELDAARRLLKGPSDDLSLAEAERLASIWLSWVLEEDEEGRRLGLSEWDPRKKVEAADIVEAGGGVALALAVAMDGHEAWRVLPAPGGLGSFNSAGA